MKINENFSCIWLKLTDETRNHFQLPIFTVHIQGMILFILTALLFQKPEVKFLLHTEKFIFFDELFETLKKSKLFQLEVWVLNR